MSAASAVRVESPLYFEAANVVPAINVAPPTEEVVRNLVHDLRQPLSSIEAIAYFLEMTLPPDQHEAREHMRRLQHLVDHAETILNRAGASIRKPPARVDFRPDA